MTGGNFSRQRIMQETCETGETTRSYKSRHLMCLSPDAVEERVEERLDEFVASALVSVEDCSGRPVKT